MSTILVDLDAKQVGGAQGPVPKGRYDAVVFDIQPQVSKKGNPYQLLIFDLYDGPVAGETEYSGTRIWCRKPWMFNQLLLACEVIVPGQTGQIEIETQALIEQPVVLDLSQSEYNGKLGNEVDVILSVQTALELQAAAANQIEIPF